MSQVRNRTSLPGFALLTALLLGGCRTPPVPETTNRRGDEMVVAGRVIHTGTRVITWKDTGGYDAYQGVRRDEAGAPASFSSRRTANDSLISAGDFEALLGIVDQVVLHYDASGLSRLCFDRLRERQLSAHFLVDLDGTVYQTLDLQERAYHATVSNSRSIGIEIANIGSFPVGEDQELRLWYREDHEEGTRIVSPLDVEKTGILTAGFVARPARPDPVRGIIQGKELMQYDFTPEQYAALEKLTAALCRTFPRLQCDFPRDADGNLVQGKLPDDTLTEFHGILGHFHIQEDKVDPGPAFQWERILPQR